MSLAVKVLMSKLNGYRQKRDPDVAETLSPAWANDSKAVAECPCDFLFCFDFLCSFFF